jgi:hypothetical protein
VNHTREAKFLGNEADREQAQIAPERVRRRGERADVEIIGLVAPLN